GQLAVAEELRPAANDARTGSVSPLGGTQPAQPAQQHSPGTERTLSFVGTPGGALARVHGLRGDVHVAAAPAGATPTPPPPPARDAEPVLTGIGVAMGSPPYMAPEQWDDSATTT